MSSKRLFKMSYPPPPPPPSPVLASFFFKLLELILIFNIYLCVTNCQWKTPMGSVNKILCCIVYFNFNIRKENKTLRFHCFKMSPNFSHRRLNSLEIRPITSQNNRWSTCCFRGFCTDVLGFCTFFRSLIIKFDAQLQKDPPFNHSCMSPNGHQQQNVSLQYHY